MKEKLFIGIDPDVDKSGFALWLPEFKELMLNQYSLFDLFNELLGYHKNYDLTVVLEAGHKVKKTWHKGGNGMAKRVGANNEIGRQIEKFLTDNKISFELVMPKGYSSYTHKDFCKITGYKGQTNSEKRVSGLLVYGRK